MLEFIVSKTYAVITEDSAQHGDAAERGYVFEDEKFSFRELINELRCYDELSSTRVDERTWASMYDDMDFKTGDTTEYSLHIHAINGKPPTARQLHRLFKTAGLVKGPVPRTGEGRRA